MNAQELEYVRLELTRALVDRSGRTKGQLEAFSEHPPANKIHCRRQPIYKVELEGERWVSVGLMLITLPFMCWKHAAPAVPCRRLKTLSLPLHRGVVLLIYSLSMHRRGGDIVTASI